MKIIKKGFLTLLALALLTTGILYASGHGYIFTAIKRTYLAGHATANVNDYSEFETQLIRTNSPKALVRTANFEQHQLSPTHRQALADDGALAYMVIKDGEVYVEDYFNGYDDRSRTNSFSMAKTVLTLMLGIAIEQGHVKSLDQPLSDFLPEFKDEPLGSKATIGQLSWMNSGYEWVEHYYTPFSPTVELYYGDDVRDFLLNREFSAEPGSFWEYSSASTQLLGIALLRALQKTGTADSLSNYLSQTLWQPMQMNDDAIWHADNSDMELVYCCINTNARNFAKLGLLMLNNGDWDGQQLVPSHFINKMITPKGKEFYGLSTWLGMHKEPAHYLFSGHLGQYIIVVPGHNMVVVRLGEKSPQGEFLDDTAPSYIKLALELIE